MTKIITLTLSPAFDVHCFCADFKPFHENLASVTSRDAGGKGVNISRALALNGVKNLAIVALGEENAADFEGKLKADGIAYSPIYRAGRIRENITLHTSNNPETRISFAGFSTDESLLSEADTIIGNDLSETIITFTGRVPNGISMDAVKAFLKNLQAKGARIVLDSKSFSAEVMLEVSPWLIKPNEEEISDYTTHTVGSQDDVIAAARELSERGIENVMISFGAKGAILSTAEGCYWAHPPKIEARSTIGAGDSSIAGFLAATAKGKAPKEALRTAIAFGTAACLTEGTLPPLPTDVETIFAAVNVEKIG